MSNRREFLQTTGLAMGAMSLGVHATGNAQESGSLPNLVIMLCDDLGYGDLSCYGHSIIQTPYLDQMAQEGMRFTDCYAASPVCSPARAGMITGRTPYRCHVTDWIPPNSPMHLQQNEISIARLLKDRGYATAHFGKWHLSGKLDGSQPTPGYHGFDHWFSTLNNAHPSHLNPTNFVRNGEPVDEPIEGHASRIIVDEALDFIEKTQMQSPGRPFAVFVWFHAPHEPVGTSPQFTDLYANIEEETKRLYFGNVTETDAAVGHFNEQLDRKGLSENTLVWFTSDNGPETLNRYRGAHRSHGTPGPLRGMKLHMYEGGIRVPGIARWPGQIPAGQENSLPVSGVDVLPTLCGLAGLPIPDDRPIDGADVAALLRNNASSRGKPLYWRYDKAISNPKIALRDGDWKLLANAELSQFELYNLREDLAESRDVSQANPNQLRALKEQLYAIHADVENDPVSDWTPWRIR